MNFVRVFVKKFLSNFLLIDSFCKSCGIKIVNFRVSNKIWREVMGDECNKEFCYNCFSKKSNKIWYLIDEKNTESILIEAIQLLDGWHQDGTYWTEWDEKVRKQLSQFLKRNY